jgi:hypothetical protein
MIQFNELRIDSEKNLIIDASVLDITDDPNGYIHINHVFVGVGSNQELVDLDLNGPYVTRRDNSTGYLRGIRIMLNLTNAATGSILNTECDDLTKQLYYIKVEVDTTDPVVPIFDCTVNTFIEGCAYDRCLLMNKVFDYIKATDGTCDNFDNYANYIVKVNGLQLAVESGNFTLALTYWNKFFANNNSNVGLISNTGCGCHQ